VARGSAAASVGHESRGRGGVRAGGCRGSGAGTLYLVLDGLVECAGHVVEREDSGEGKVGVDAVFEIERGEADEVVGAILAYGRVDGELDIDSCCDIDRVWEGNRLEEGLLGHAACVESDSTVALISKGYNFAVVSTSDITGLATRAGGPSNRRGNSEFSKGGNSKSSKGSDDGGRTHS